MKVIKKEQNSNDPKFKEQLAKNLEGLKLNDLDGVTCTNCDNPTFIQVFLLRKISAVLSPSGKGGFLPLPVFQCSSCGFINDELMPKTDV